MQCKGWRVLQKECWGSCQRTSIRSPNLTILNKRWREKWQKNYNNGMKKASKKKTEVDVEEQVTHQQTSPSTKKTCPTSAKKKLLLKLIAIEMQNIKSIANVTRTIIRCVKWCSYLCFTTVANIALIISEWSIKRKIRRQAPKYQCLFLLKNVDWWYCTFILGLIGTHFTMIQMS